MRQVSAATATQDIVSKISWGLKIVVHYTFTMPTLVYLKEDQKVLEHDLEGKEDGDQEGAAYWDQSLQDIEDDVADEVVEGDERREDIEGCPSNTEKRNINYSCWTNSDKFYLFTVSTAFWSKADIVWTLVSLLLLFSSSA